jgi:hypothetical protein
MLKDDSSQCIDSNVGMSIEQPFFTSPCKYTDDATQTSYFWVRTLRQLCLHIISIFSYQSLALNIVTPNSLTPISFVGQPASDKEGTYYPTDYSDDIPQRQSLNLQLSLANFILQLTTLMAIHLPTTRSTCCRVPEALSAMVTLLPLLLFGPI